MFVRINPDQLVVGKAYKISKYKGYYKEKIYWGQLYYIFEKVRIGACMNTLQCSPRFYTFYQYVSDNPQGKMERRAVTMIVRRLIGDDCFEW